MERQLDLWASEQPRPTIPPIWERIGAEQRTALVATLARLMIQAVYPDHPQRTGDKTHER